MDFSKDIFHRIGEDIILIDKLESKAISGQLHESDYCIGAQLLKGSADVNINGIGYHVKAPAICLLMPGLPYQVSNTSSDYQSRAVVLSNNFMTSLYDMSLKVDEIRMALYLKPIHMLTESSKRELNLYVEVMKTVAEHNDDTNALMCIRYTTMSYFYASMIYMCRLEADENTARASRIAADFQILLANNFREEHKTGFYAARLNISEKYLYISVKTVMGLSPSHIIEYRLLAEAKSLLTSSEKSILEISDELSFTSQSHFSKFFKHLTGYSPLEYRNKFN